MRAVSTVLGVLILAVAGMVWIREARARERAERNEHEAARAMRTLARAQRLFWNDDLNDNLTVDYWTGDVRGLHLPHHFGGLIPVELAQADGRRPNAEPYSGYFFIAIECGDSRRFAFCAYPAEYGRTGRWTFIGNETGSLFKFDTRGKAVPAWPALLPQESYRVEERP